MTANGKTLRVLLTDKDVGQLTQRPNGSYWFEYLPDWQHNPRHIPLSRSMPLQQQRHGVRPITNFMWGLLPDNEQTLDEWAKRFQVSARNLFALLAAVGEDCPGAVQLVPPDVELAGRENVKRLTRKELEARMVALKNDPGAGRLAEDAGQFSLAGAQAKTALYKIKNSWAVPHGRTPTTHIFKPETGRIRHIASNEHFCLELARRLDLPAALSKVEVMVDVPVIIVERYDRVRGTQGVFRVHQEDMCQALGVNPLRKYQADAGRRSSTSWPCCSTPPIRTSTATASCARRRSISSSPARMRTRATTRSYMRRAARFVSRRSTTSSATCPMPPTGGSHLWRWASTGAACSRKSSRGAGRRSPPM